MRSGTPLAITMASREPPPISRSVTMTRRSFTYAARIAVLAIALQAVGAGVLHLAITYA